MDFNFAYFTDPVLRGPTIGSMLMCLSAALVGVLVFLRKQSLLGEALSHAAYPGVILGVILAGVFEISDSNELLLIFFIGIGAFASSLAGLFFIGTLQKRLNISQDASLCFVLSSFFGIGITLASSVQFSYSSLYRFAQSYLYGQVATMTDAHILVYGVLSLAITAAIFLFYKELQAMTFSFEYAKSLGIPVKAIEALVFVLVASAVVIGIRSVGVVLMSAMLIAPAVSARQYSHHLFHVFILAMCFGAASGFLGCVFSSEASFYFAMRYPEARFNIPTGPTIVLAASFMCIFSVAFAPEKGLLIRLMRIGKFHFQCLSENILKFIWRSGPKQGVAFAKIRKYQGVSPVILWIVLRRLVKNGWIKKKERGNYSLTKEGTIWAAEVVRLHRLWEVYLVDYLGASVERVHKSAEEMEHIITPELERELTKLLKDPKEDPHRQAIPSKEHL